MSTISPDVVRQVIQEVVLEVVAKAQASHNGAGGGIFPDMDSAIAAAGGPAYGSRWIDPQDGTDGGQPGGNIRQVFLYRLDRDLEFVDRPGGDATTAAEVTGTGRSTALSVSPGRIC